MSMVSNVRGTAVYDGDCGFCQRSVDFIAARLRHPVTIVSWQQADLAALDLTEEQCRTALQYRASSGKLSSGAAGIAELLLLCNPGWRSVGLLLKLPVVRGVAKRVYRAIATNRQRLPGPAACTLPTVEVTETDISESTASQGNDENLDTSRNGDPSEQGHLR